MVSYGFVSMEHLKLVRIEGFVLTQITLIKGFVLFPHKQCGKHTENVAPHILHGSKICAVFLRYISCTSLVYNTCRSCTISMHFNVKII
jgi:hypothetical protein